MVTSVGIMQQFLPLLKLILYLYNGSMRSGMFGIKNAPFVLKFDLHPCPYKIQIEQKLTKADKDKRLKTCEWFCNVHENDEKSLENVWFSDKANFSSAFRASQ